LSTDPLVNRGGPVETAPRIYVDFWGWTADPAGEQSYLTSFLSSVGSSSWLKTVRQYGAKTAPVLAGQWTDTGNSPASSPTATAIGDEASVAAVHFGITAGPATFNDQIIVALPSGTDFATAGPNACAWHSIVTVGTGTVTSPATFTALPYIPEWGSCGTPFVNAGNRLDGVSIVEGHELAETITDPLINAWLDSSGNEIADKCAWVGLEDITTSGGTFAMQPLWSNRTSSCVLAGASPPTAGPLTGSATTVYAAGGQVTMLAPVTNARKCTLRFVLQKFTITSEPCRPPYGEFGTTYDLNPNTTGRTIVYSFILTVSGVQQTLSARTLVVTQLATPPPHDCVHAVPFGDMSGCDLTGANLSGLTLTQLNLAGARLVGANLAGTDLAGADLTSADLTGADLTSASIGNTTVIGTRFTSVTWQNTTCPDRTNSSFYIPQTCIGHGI
jgi:hypothetical protein